MKKTKKKSTQTDESGGEKMSVIPNYKKHEFHEDIQEYWK